LVCRAAVRRWWQGTLGSNARRLSQSADLVHFKITVGDTGVLHRCNAHSDHPSAPRAAPEPSQPTQFLDHRRNACQSSSQTAARQPGRRHRPTRAAGCCAFALPPRRGPPPGRPTAATARLVPCLLRFCSSSRRGSRPPMSRSPPLNPCDQPPAASRQPPAASCTCPKPAADVVKFRSVMTTPRAAARRRPWWRRGPAGRRWQEAR
jgi:hypothetical protein